MSAHRKEDENSGHATTPQFWRGHPEHPDNFLVFRLSSWGPGIEGGEMEYNENGSSLRQTMKTLHLAKFEDGAA